MKEALEKLIEEAGQECDAFHAERGIPNTFGGFYREEDRIRHSFLEGIAVGLRQALDLLED